METCINFKFLQFLTQMAKQLWRAISLLFWVLSWKGISKEIISVQKLSKGLPKTGLELFTSPENRWIFISETPQGPVSKKLPIFQRSWSWSQTRDFSKMLHCHRQEREGQISPLGGQSDGDMVVRVIFWLFWLSWIWWWWSWYFGYFGYGGGRDILDMVVVVIFWQNIRKCVGEWAPCKVSQLTKLWS